MLSEGREIEGQGFSSNHEGFHAIFLFFLSINITSIIFRLESSLCNAEEDVLFLFSIFQHSYWCVCVMHFPFTQKINFASERFHQHGDLLALQHVIKIQIHMSIAIWIFLSLPQSNYIIL